MLINVFHVVRTKTTSARAYPEAYLVFDCGISPRASPCHMDRATCSLCVSLSTKDARKPEGRDRRPCRSWMLDRHEDRVPHATARQREARHHSRQSSNRRDKEPHSARQNREARVFRRESAGGASASRGPQVVTSNSRRDPPLVRVRMRIEVPRATLGGVVNARETQWIERRRRKRASVLQRITYEASAFCNPTITPLYGFLYALNRSKWAPTAPSDVV
jgi:hypothetical protein